MQESEKDKVVKIELRNLTYNVLETRMTMDTKEGQKEKGPFQYPFDLVDDVDGAELIISKVLKDLGFVTEGRKPSGGQESLEETEGWLKEEAWDEEKDWSEQFTVGTEGIKTGKIKITCHLLGQGVHMHVMVSTNGGQDHKEKREFFIDMDNAVMASGVLCRILEALGFQSTNWEITLS